MPNYDYRCYNCGQRIRLFFTYADYDAADPKCTNCDSKKLKRIISRIALAKSEETRLDSLDPDSLLSGLDEDDPRSVGRFRKKRSSDMGVE